MGTFPTRMGATDVGDDDASKDLGYARLRRSYAARNAHCLETRLTPCALNRDVTASAQEKILAPATQKYIKPQAQSFALDMKSIEQVIAKPEAYEALKEKLNLVKWGRSAPRNIKSKRNMRSLHMQPWAQTRVGRMVKPFS
jgi:hypothetical protein